MVGPTPDELGIAGYAHIVNACCRGVWCAESPVVRPSFDPNNPDTYHVEQWLGQGAFGTVSIVTAENGTRVMAVKMASSGKEAALRNEVDVLNKLGIHRNIVTLFGMLEPTSAWEPVRFFMEYVGGGTIAALAQSLAGVSEEEARAIIRQLLYGLEHIHAQKVIHRDIKGANILISPTGCVKIADLGISRIHIGDAKSFAGSGPYIAPEVYTGSRYDSKIDLWSVGGVIVEILHGTHPWAGIPAMSLCLKVSRFEFPKPDKVSPTLENLFSKVFCAPNDRHSATMLLGHPWLTTSAA
ncbi:mitogen-activated protein kinase [Favolaschia claudopus]|uniref:Mitogen-activated protein kinase n=1 Tax=Favolaschia claudopus TaxID=2862362 RepID=A0AAW0BHP5_9AGAR